MRILAVGVLVGAMATCAWSNGAWAQAPERTPAQDFYAASLKGDCNGYETVGAKALASRTDADAEACVAVAAGACAARAGRLDLAERYGERLVAAGPVIGETMLAILGRRYGLLVADAPGGGPVAARVLDRIAAAAPMATSRHNLRAAYAQALFAAGRLDEGRAVLGNETLLPLTQVDRRFEPAWRSPEALAAALRDRPPAAPLPADADWRLRFWTAVNAGRDEEALAIGRHQIAIETDDGVPWLFQHDRRGWDVRQDLIYHLVELGRVEEALAMFDQGVADGREPTMRDHRRNALLVLGPALLRADRAADARRLLDAEMAIGQFFFDEEQTFDQMRGCAGEGARPARFSSWMAALDCGAPEAEIATLLMAALEDPEHRSWAILWGSRQPASPVFGRRDAEYRRTWAAVFDRPEIKAAVERRGRFLPTDLVRAMSR
jgi:tetratricopeptide (TPR) repeat protein